MSFDLFFFLTALNSPLEEPVLGSTVKYNELCDLKMCKLMSSQMIQEKCVYSVLLLLIRSLKYLSNSFSS